MPRKAYLVSVLCLLALVVFITASFPGSRQQYQEEQYQEGIVPGPVPVREQISDEGDFSSQVQEAGLPETEPGHQPASEIPVPGRAGLPTKPSASAAVAKEGPARPVKPTPLQIQWRNKETDNLNILFVGADGSRLLMAAVYSINYQEEFQSGSVFFPVNTLVQGQDGPVTLEFLFRQEGVPAMAAALAKTLGVRIAYYIRIDQRILAEVNKFLPPIVVDGETVMLEKLFEITASPKDDRILGALLQELTRPRVFFIHLPKLVVVFRRYLETDFAINPENLWLHYRIATKVDTAGIPKVIIPGLAARWRGQPAIEPEEEAVKNIIYRLTL